MFQIMDFKKTVWMVAVAGMLARPVFSAEQKISLFAENQTLGAVLQSIEKASGVSVVLSDKKWADAKVSFAVKDSDLEKALNLALSQYDYVLEWYATGNDFSKVVVTIHERKPDYIGLPGRSHVMLNPDKVPMANHDLDALAEVYCKEVIGTNSMVKSVAGLDMETVRAAYADLRKVVKK